MRQYKEYAQPCDLSEISKIRSQFTICNGNIHFQNECVEYNIAIRLVIRFRRLLLNLYIFASRIMLGLFHIPLFSQVSYVMNKCSGLFF